MIRSFRDRDTELVFRRRPSRRLPAEIQRVALRRLTVLHAATSLQDLLVPPGNRLEKLRGAYRGQYSLRINGRWRVCFLWHRGDAHRVEIVDYH